MTVSGKIMNHKFEMNATNHDGNKVIVRWLDEFQKYTVFYRYKEECQYLVFDEDELEFLIDAIKIGLKNRNM